MIVGTSVSTAYVSSDQGTSWVKISNTNPVLSSGAQVNCVATSRSGNYQFLGLKEIPIPRDEVGNALFYRSARFEVELTN